MNILRQPCNHCSRYYKSISTGRMRRASSEAFAATRQDSKPSFESGSSNRHNTNSRLSQLRIDTVLPKHLYKPTSNKIDTSMCKLSEYQINKMIRDRGHYRATRMYDKADEILQQLNKNGVFLDDKVKQWGIGTKWRSGTRVKYTTQVKDCSSIKEAVELTHSCLKTGLTTRNLSSFWSVVPQLLQQHNSSNDDDDFELPNQLESLLTQTLENVDSFSYKDLAQTVLGLAKIIKQVGSSDTVFQEDSPHQLLYNLLIGDDSKSKQFVFRHIACAPLHILPEFDPRHMSNFIYAYALADYVPDFDDGSTLFDILAVEVIPNLIYFNSQDFANTLWAYANSKENNSTLFQEAGDIISESNLDEYKPQELASILWAYAKASESHPRLFNRVGDYITSLDNLDEYKPQELTQLAWAYSTAKEKHPLLFEKVADHIVTVNNMKQYTTQAISNICWAYGASDDSHSQLFKTIADYIASDDNNLDEFGPHALSNIVRANAIQMKQMYIFADEWHPTLFEKVADYIIGLDNLNSYVGQDVSNILWSYATAKEKNAALFTKMTEHIISLDNLDDFSAQSLSNIVWACATSNESHPSLFDKIADAAFSRQNEFTSQGIVNFLWANATNGQIDRILFLSFVPTVKSMLAGFNRQELANVAWTYAVANVRAPSLFNDDFIEAILKKEEDEFTLEALVQLHQWQLWQIEIKSGVRLPDSLREKCYEAFLLRVPEPSKFQSDVITSLASIGLYAEEEVLTKSGYRIDMIAEAHGKKVAVEIDGPSHFIGRSREPNGSTILKRRQVSNLEGMQVLSVPFFHWNRLKTDSCKKQQYLRTVLSLNCYKAP